MNFFGHAAVARQVDDDPDFVLGAMAPDLLAMCGATGERPTSARVAAGQAHHLAVDAAFHGSAAFVTLQSWAVRNLIGCGLRRGPARGAAHVGIELLLDGELACDGRARVAYDRSLATADGSGQPFLWPDESAGDPLADAGPPTARRNDPRQLSAPGLRGRQTGRGVAQPAAAGAHTRRVTGAADVLAGAAAARGAAAAGPDG